MRLFQAPQALFMNRQDAKSAKNLAQNATYVPYLWRSLRRGGENIIPAVGGFKEVTC